jgi:hypothetical protein
MNILPRISQLSPRVIHILGKIKDYLNVKSGDLFSLCIQLLSFAFDFIHII